MCNTERQVYFVIWCASYTVTYIQWDSSEHICTVNKISNCTCYKLLLTAFGKSSCDKAAICVDVQGCMESVRRDHVWWGWLPNSRISNGCMYWEIVVHELNVVDSLGLTINSCQGCLKVTWLWAATRKKTAPTGTFCICVCCVTVFCQIGLCGTVASCEFCNCFWISQQKDTEAGSSGVIS